MRFSACHAWPAQLPKLEARYQDVFEAEGKWSGFETDMLSPDSQSYSDKVFYTWCHGYDERLDGMKARERQKRNLARILAFSGVLDDPLAI